MVQSVRSVATVFWLLPSALVYPKESPSKSGEHWLDLTAISTAQQNSKLNSSCLWVVYLWWSFSSLYRLNRASQTYLFPIHLTDQILPSAVFYATVGPLAIYLAVQKLIIMPYIQAQKEQWVIIHNNCSETAHFPETPVFTLPQFLWWKACLFGCLQGVGETEGGFCFRNCSQEARSWSCCE